MCTASPVRADRLGEIVLKLKKKKINKETKRPKKKTYKKGGNGRKFGNCCLHGLKKTSLSPCITLSL